MVLNFFDYFTGIPGQFCSHSGTTRGEFAQAGTIHRRFRLRQDGQLHHEDRHEAASAHPANLRRAGHQRPEKGHSESG